jgi:hypothetical protein
MGSHHALPVTFTLSVSLFMLARKRPAVGSIRTLELDGKTYTKLNEGGRITTCAGGAASVSGGGCCRLLACSDVMVQALATILLRTGTNLVRQGESILKQRNALNRGGHPPD